MHGWIILDKPEGMTSVQASARVKRLTGQKKIGHAGTLDPLATGVLPLALGEATKTVPYIEGVDKAYRFTVTWGQERNTDDAEGEVTQTSDKRPTRADLEAVLPSLRGDILQVPPAFSAIKVAGERSYALARKGEAVELQARPATIHSIEIEEFSEVSAVLNCHCTKGTYVRALARDIGRKIGCLGYVSTLRRTAVGNFSESHAISLDNLAEIVHKGGHFLLPVESVLDDIPALQADSFATLRLRHGQGVNAFHFGMAVREVESSEGLTYRLMQQERLLAICSMKGGELQPVRVFNLSN